MPRQEAKIKKKKEKSELFDHVRLQIKLVKRSGANDHCS